jgi:hypothetical protein
MNIMPEEVQDVPNNDIQNCHPVPWAVEGTQDDHTPVELFIMCLLALIVLLFQEKEATTFMDLGAFFLVGGMLGRLELRKKLKRTLRGTNASIEQRYWFKACEPSTPVEILEKLSRSTEKGIRMSVALNPSTPPSVLKELVQDDDCDVRLSVISNPHVPIDILIMHAHDADRDVQLSVVSNPHVPPEVLDEYARVADRDVLFTVISNPNVQPATLEKIALCCDDEVL